MILPASTWVQKIQVANIILRIQLQSQNPFAWPHGNASIFWGAKFKSRKLWHPKVIRTGGVIATPPGRQLGHMLTHSNSQPVLVGFRINHDMDTSTNRCKSPIPLRKTFIFPDMEHIYENIWVADWFITFCIRYIIAELFFGSRSDAKLFRFAGVQMLCA